MGCTRPVASKVSWDPAPHLCSLLRALVFLAPVVIMTTTRPAEVNNGVTTSWLPFTTAGVSVSTACFSEIFRVPGSSDIVALDPYYEQNQPNGMTCLPAEVTSSWEQATSGATVTSLGPFNCPSLYSTAAIATINTASDIIACCPTGYSFRDTDDKCVSIVEAGGTLIVKTLTGVVQRDNSDDGLTVTAFGVTGYSFANQVTASAPAAATPTLPPTTAPSAVAVGMATPPPSIPISSPQPTSASLSTSPSHASTSRGLGVGAKVGITIGIVFTVIIIVVLLAGLHIKRRRNKNRGSSSRRSEDGGGIIEISRAPREEKHRKPQQRSYPMMDGLQAALALAPDDTIEENKGYPEVITHIAEHVHEMDVSEGVEYEMDAGSIKRPAIKSMKIMDEAEWDRRSRAESRAESKAESSGGLLSRDIKWPQPRAGSAGGAMPRERERQPPRSGSAGSASPREREWQPRVRVKTGSHDISTSRDRQTRNGDEGAGFLTPRPQPTDLRQPKSKEGGLETLPSQQYRQNRNGNTTVTITSPSIQQERDRQTRSPTHLITPTSSGHPSPISQGTTLSHDPFISQTPTPSRRAPSQNTSLNDLRNPGRTTSFSRNTDRTGRVTPGTDSRLDIHGGWISPISTADRSFLDLSD